jgi:hypothetical protein
MRNDNHHYVCSRCGAEAGYDGRCGDGPYLTCECVSEKNSRWIDDGRGGYSVSRGNPEPIHVSKSDHWNRPEPGPSGLS